INYFARFVWAFPTTSTTTEEVIRYLTWLFGGFDAPIAVYSDRKPFASAEMKAFLKTFDTIHIAASIASHRSVGIAEKASDLFQQVLKKRYGNWPSEIVIAVKALNSRVIDRLGYSPHEIFFNFPPGQVMDKFIPSINKLEIQPFLQLNPQFIDTEDDTLFAQLNFIANRHQPRQIVIDRDNYRRTVQKDRHDTGVRGQTLVPGDLVMLYDEKEAKKTTSCVQRTIQDNSFWRRS
ncbi:hypothetical protein GcC1_093020, partial [Golovinomyces cichoracearum]